MCQPNQQIAFFSALVRLLTARTFTYVSTVSGDQGSLLGLRRTDVKEEKGSSRK